MRQFCIVEVRCSDKDANWFAHYFVDFSDPSTAEKVVRTSLSDPTVQEVKFFTALPGKAAKSIKLEAGKIRRIATF